MMAARLLFPFTHKHANNKADKQANQQNKQRNK